GCHYMSRSYKNLLKRYKITQSMSRKGNCYDNACIESFFSKLKTELIYQNKYYSKKIYLNQYINIFIGIITKDSNQN
ncbi:IS3 family transposase, partial [Clostridium botulinum]